MKPEIAVIDFRRKARYMIVKAPLHGYDLVFVGWNYTKKPDDYVDPILLNASFDECFNKLSEIVKGQILDHELQHERRSEMAKIKPCPFCGYDGPLDIWVGDNEYNGTPICIICPECEARGPCTYVDPRIIDDLLDKISLIAGLTRWNIRASQGGAND